MTDSLTPESIAQLVERLTDAADAMNDMPPEDISLVSVAVLTRAAASALSALAAERDEWKRAAHVYDHVPLSSVPTAPEQAR